MAVSADVTISQDGAGNAKLHPYLITLLRWCVSCVWSTASVLLHRLVLVPLPAIKASKQTSKIPKLRQAGTEHLHPEPKVECVVLHTPDVPTLDVIFVHGLYGSLANTWRQGDWRSKYKLDPQKISLRNHTTPCECQTKNQQYINYTYETNLNEKVSFKQINSCFNKILPNENTLITEKFYNNTVFDVNVNNYETQAKFVSEMFKNENKNSNLNMNTFRCNLYGDKCKCKLNDKLNECVCKLNDKIKVEKCKIGCGCVCEECYSYCWPKDWVKEDFPGARIISINYTSDPHLWRPLWVKGNKRLRLHERAEQMMEQLIDLGVGKRPIIWVGHSKGGLFIKQIYCEAYDAYNKMKTIDIKNEDRDETKTNNLDNNFNIYNKEIIVNNNNNQSKLKSQEKPSKINSILSKYFLNKNEDFIKSIDNLKSNDNFINNIDNLKSNDNFIKNIDNLKSNDSFIKNIDNLKSNDNFIKNIDNLKSNDNFIKNIDNLKSNDNFILLNENFNLLKYTEGKNTELCGCNDNDDFEENKQAINEEFLDMNEDRNVRLEAMSLYNEEDLEWLQARSSLWHQSAGFMFYSVPHRGSPLADIKTPITARSIELLEISKDCELVVDLQERWLVATSTSRPVVRSLVETCRTLMSVLWLRIVSVDSADAGVGSLYGVSVDHREICKPSSRTCLLYTELTSLIQAAIHKCSCRTNEKHT